MKLFSLFKSDNLKTLEIGGRAYLIKIPKKYLWEYDDEGTLLFYPPGKEIITIRVTVLSFNRKDGKQNHGPDIVMEEAMSKKLDYEILSDGVAFLETPPEHKIENGTQLIMQFGYVGRDNSLIIFSSTVILEYEKRHEVLEMKNDLRQIFKSITKP